MTCVLLTRKKRYQVGALCANSSVPFCLQSVPIRAQITSLYLHCSDNLRTLFLKEQTNKTYPLCTFISESVEEFDLLVSDLLYRYQEMHKRFGIRKKQNK